MRSSSILHHSEFRLIISLNTLISTDSAIQWSPPSEEEKRLRSDLLYRCIEAMLEERVPRILIYLLGGQREFRIVIRNVLDVFQLPRLNKQLAFVLMDRIIQKLAADGERDVVGATPVIFE